MKKKTLQNGKKFYTTNQKFSEMEKKILQNGKLWKSL